MGAKGSKDREMATEKRERPARMEFVGPLQRLTTPVAYGWIVVAEEAREVSGIRFWRISALKPEADGWCGHGLPFRSTNPDMMPAPYHMSYTVEERDAEIERLTAFVLNPCEMTRYRDFTCPHCHLTERDGNHGPDGAAKICFYCHKSSVMTRCVLIAATY